MPRSLTNPVFVPLFLAAGLLAPTAAPTAATAAVPTLVAEPAAVALMGATPGGEVAWLSVARVPLGYFERVEVRRRVTRADASGRAQIELGAEPAERSIWAAVDMATGAFALMSPAEEGLREEPFARDAFLTDEDGVPDRVRHEHFLLETLLVRPAAEGGAGAWGARTADGEPEDADGTVDGTVTLPVSGLGPVTGEAAPPARFEVGDILVAIDPERLEVSAVEITAEAVAGGER